MHDHNHGPRKLRAVSFSLIVNVFLTLLKLVVVVLTGSVAILAELFHSALDMLASAVAYVGIKKADEPADEEHHYGHEKFENLSSLVQTVLIVITAVFVIYESLDRLWHPVKIEATELGLVAMFTALIVDFFLSRYLHTVSHESGSPALEANAYHFTTDLWGIIAVIVGLALVMLGYPFFDSLAAIVVAAMMLWISYHLGKKAIYVLTDKSPSEELVTRIAKAVSGTKGIRSYHKLRARQAGNRLLVSLDIQVDPKISVAQGHRLAHQAKQRIMEAVPEVKEAVIHVEPSEETSG